MAVSTASFSSDAFSFLVTLASLLILRADSAPLPHLLTLVIQSLKLFFVILACILMSITLLRETCLLPAEGGPRLQR